MKKVFVLKKLYVCLFRNQKHNQMTFQELNKLIESLKREPIKNANLISFYERKKSTIISDAITTAINSVINQNQTI
jgi:hypothetical protein